MFKSALGKALDKVTIGDPRLKEVRMGSLVSHQQVQAVRDSVNDLAKEAQIVYGSLDEIKPLEQMLKKALLLVLFYYEQIILFKIQSFTNVKHLVQ